MIQTITLNKIHMMVRILRMVQQMWEHARVGRTQVQTASLLYWRLNIWPSERQSFESIGNVSRDVSSYEYVLTSAPFIFSQEIFLKE